MAKKMHHFAAGGVVFHRCTAGIKYLVLVQQREGLGYILPKGHIEWAETPEECALREVSEESGLDALVQVAFLGKTSHTYSLPLDDHLHHKEVNWFLFESASLKVFPEKTEYFVDYLWLSYEEAKARMTYENEFHMVTRSFELLHPLQ